MIESVALVVAHLAFNALLVAAVLRCIPALTRDEAVSTGTEEAVPELRRAA
jgi:hypothetical protein